MNKVIIDTDPGQDDAIAIMLLTKSKVVSIEALTTVAGNSDLQNVTNNARFITDLLGLNTPIYSGADKPLKKELVTANVHGQTGLDGVEVTKTEPLTNNAVDKIIEIVRKNPNEITIIVIGPQTNIALAFQKDKELPKLVKELVILGGAINVPGNKNRVAEFNIFVDPDAAAIVFDAPVKKTLIPIDVCNITPLFMSDFQKIKESTLTNAMISMMRKYIKAIKKFENMEGALVYDALATYYLINPSAYTTTPMDIKIETKGEWTNGMTVADKTTWGNKVPNVDVVTSLDREKFVKDFISIFNQAR